MNVHPVRLQIPEVTLASQAERNLTRGGRGAGEEALVCTELREVLPEHPKVGPLKERLSLPESGSLPLGAGLGRRLARSRASFAPTAQVQPLPAQQVRSFRSVHV